MSGLASNALVTVLALSQGFDVHSCPPPRTERVMAKLHIDANYPGSTEYKISNTMLSRA